jgi:hypothetical protein
MKKFFALNLLLLSFAAGFALEVNKQELESLAANKEIEFINYEGPHAVINTVAQIKGIGSEIGAQIASDVSKKGHAGNNGRYSVIHAVDSSVKEKLDADILIIGNQAQIDHINNLRRIISGYLTAAYKYSETDADTLAVFITVYNAVYRSNIGAFFDKYKAVVTDNLDANYCGLSVDYRDWPGKTQIVIPLYDVNNGGLSTIDTSVISDKNVISSMKEDDDMNIDSRKNLVDLKERESEDAGQNAKNAQKQATEENKKLEEEKAKQAQLKAEAEEADKKAEEKQKIADRNPQDEQAQREAEKAKNEAEEKQKALERQEEIVKEQTEKTEAERESAKKQQALSDRKETEAQSERKDIAKDQVTVQNAQAENTPENLDYGLLLVDEKKQYSKIVKFNKKNGKAVKDSPVNVIHNRELIRTGDNFAVVAGENKGAGAVKLVLIDRENMEIILETEEKLTDNSPLVYDGGYFYCIISEKGGNYLGKFDSSLRLVMKSVEAVKGASPVIITENAITVTGSDGKIKILEKSDISSKIGSGK